MIERNVGSMDDLISRKAVFELLDDIDSIYLEDYDDTFKSYTDLVNALFDEDRLPSAQPETHDKRTKTHSCDLISRQAAIDAVENIDCSDGVGISALKCEAVDDGVTAIKALPSAQPETVDTPTVDTPTVDTPNCDDTISRQAAIDAILAVTGNSSVRELYEHVQEHGLSDMWSGGVNAAIDIIIAVPSAQPDLSGYSDKLWKKAYERGKAEAQDEIVRCKDCIKREICRTSTTWAVAPKDDWYCADAERRTNESD